MRASRVNTDIAQRIKQVVVLFILVIAGIIVTLSSEAKPLSPKVHDRYDIIKKHNKMYSNACSLLKEKRNKKDKAKAYKGKYR